MIQVAEPTKKMSDKSWCNLIFKNIISVFFSFIESQVKPAVSDVATQVTHLTVTDVAIQCNLLPDFPPVGKLVTSTPVKRGISSSSDNKSEMETECSYYSSVYTPSDSSISM